MCKKKMDFAHIEHAVCTATNNGVVNCIPGRCDLYENTHKYSDLTNKFSLALIESQYEFKKCALVRYQEDDKVRWCGDVEDAVRFARLIASHPCIHAVHVVRTFDGDLFGSVQLSHFLKYLFGTFSSSLEYITLEGQPFWFSRVIPKRTFPLLKAVSQTDVQTDVHSCACYGPPSFVFDSEIVAERLYLECRGVYLCYSDKCTVRDMTLTDFAVTEDFVCALDANQHLKKLTLINPKYLERFHCIKNRLACLEKFAIVLLCGCQWNVNWTSAVSGSVTHFAIYDPTLSKNDKMCTCSYEQHCVQKKGTDVARIPTLNAIMKPGCKRKVDLISGVSDSAECMDAAVEFMSKKSRGMLPVIPKLDDAILEASNANLPLQSLRLCPGYGEIVGTFSYEYEHVNNEPSESQQTTVRCSVTRQATVRGFGEELKGISESFVDNLVANQTLRSIQICLPCRPGYYTAKQLQYVFRLLAQQPTLEYIYLQNTASFDRNGAHFLLSALEAIAKNGLANLQVLEIFDVADSDEVTMLSRVLTKHPHIHAVYVNRVANRAAQHLCDVIKRHALEHVQLTDAAVDHAEGYEDYAFTHQIRQVIRRNAHWLIKRALHYVSAESTESVRGCSTLVSAREREVAAFAIVKFGSERLARCISRRDKDSWPPYKEPGVVHRFCNGDDSINNLRLLTENKREKYDAKNFLRWVGDDIKSNFFFATGVCMRMQHENARKPSLSSLNEYCIRQITSYLKYEDIATWKKEDGEATQDTD